MFFLNMQEAWLLFHCFCPYVSILMLPNIIMCKTEVHELVHQFIWLSVGHHAATHRSGRSWVVMHFFGHQVLVFNLPQRDQS